MIMETKMRFREPATHYAALPFAEMKARASQLLDTPNIESVSVFVITNNNGPGARLSWLGKGGLITYSNVPFTPQAMAETVRQRQTNSTK